MRSTEPSSSQWDFFLSFFLARCTRTFFLFFLTRRPEGTRDFEFRGVFFVFVVGIFQKMLLFIGSLVSWSSAQKWDVVGAFAAAALAAAAVAAAAAAAAVFV